MRLLQDVDLVGAVPFLPFGLSPLAWMLRHLFLVAWTGPPPRRCSSLPAGSRRLACPLGSWPVFGSTMSRSAPPRPGCRRRPVPSSCTGEDGSSLGPRGRGESC